MVQRYAHLAPEHLRGHTDVIDTLIVSAVLNGTKTSQVNLTGELEEITKRRYTL